MENIRIVVMPSPSGAEARICVYPDRDFESRDTSDFISSDIKLQESLSRTKRLAREYRFCNNWDFFCTFTFNKAIVDRYSLSEVQKKLSQFFKNYKQRVSPDFKYMVIPEHHWDNAVHFHGLLKNVPDTYVPDTIMMRVDFTLDDKGRKIGGRLIEVPNTPGYLAWSSYKLGWCNISPVQNHWGCSNYILKYITKEIAGVDFLTKGSRLILKSEGLQRGLELVKGSLPASDSTVLRPWFEKADFEGIVEYKLDYDFCTVFDHVPLDKLSVFVDSLSGIPFSEDVDFTRFFNMFQGGK